MMAPDALAAVATALAAAKAGSDDRKAALKWARAAARRSSSAAERSAARAIIGVLEEGRKPEVRERAEPPARRERTKRAEPAERPEQSASRAERQTRRPRAESTRFAGVRPVRSRSSRCSPSPLPRSRAHAAPSHLARRERSGRRRAYWSSGARQARLHRRRRNERPLDARRPRHVGACHAARRDADASARDALERRAPRRS
jgi:hypothetical protein